MAKKKMMGGSCACAMLAAAVACAAFGSTDKTSDPKFVFLDTKTSSFWRTATNSVVTLPVRYPDGATTATLTVVGSSWSMTTNPPAGFFDLALPEPSSPETEDVYDLTLAFNDGTVRSAKLGLIQGLMPDTEGATRCVIPEGGRKWRKIRRHAVLPIPYGAESFSVTVDGQEVASDSGLDGAKGWYALDGVGIGSNASISFTLGGVSYLANLLSGDSGLQLLIK
ncbi:MAG: hypothetical protein IJG84_00930 [Kiritimatiellae bacterium]|nr:hypothetical protein [Kiritimatiellia bacterium]